MLPRGIKTTNRHEARAEFSVFHFASALAAGAANSTIRIDLRDDGDEEVEWNPRFCFSAAREAAVENNE